MSLRSLLDFFGIDPKRYVDEKDHLYDGGPVTGPIEVAELASRPEREPLGPGQQAAVDDYVRAVSATPRSIEVTVDADAEERAGLGLLDPWHEGAQEGRDYDVVTLSLTFSALTPAQDMIDHLLEAHDEVASQPDVLSFSIEVGVVDDRAFADPALRQHIFIEASMDGRRAR